ncbi:MAG: histidine kinase N-terminal domain-containing protein [Actinomycetaceae bacterium]|nr:histidine kinase N-terminal domain-containing protein [Actinomycetaceae bacterium]
MSSLSKILGRSSTLSGADREWIQQLVGDWQIVADVAFADLLLAVKNDDGLISIAAQCRPATATTFYDEDIVGVEPMPDSFRAVEQTLVDGVKRTIQREEFQLGIYPVRRDGRVIAVIGVGRGNDRNVVPSQIQSDYSDIAESLLHMITTGEFPFYGTPTGYRHGTPRLTDGFVHLDSDGVVLYASPNALSNYHRIGIAGAIVGRVLAEEITAVIEDHSVVDEALPVVVMGKAPWLAELETHGVILSLRAVPLTDRGERQGAILLCRDVTEVRRRKQELLTKDATIREINHRVKNNLQTVSALLRMQARRASNDETRSALENAQRRVATIALVHQTLSEAVEEHVDFNEVFGPLLGLTREVATAEKRVTSHFSGDFGSIGANKSTSLAVVLNELVSNAVEHGIVDGGHIEVTALRDGDKLAVDIEDNGVGIGGGGPGRGLGTKIVKALVHGELHGSINWLARPTGGTRVHIEVDVGD